MLYQEKVLKTLLVQFKTVALSEILRIFSETHWGSADRGLDHSVPGWRKEVPPGGFVGTAKWDKVFAAL